MYPSPNRVSKAHGGRVSHFSLTLCSISHDEVFFLQHSHMSSFTTRSWLLLQSSSPRFFFILVLLIGTSISPGFNRLVCNFPLISLEDYDFGLNFSRVFNFILW